jgi:hypothetical protein
MTEETKKCIGYIIESMIRTLSELGLRIIDVIEYYDIKQTPVNNTVREKIFERIRLSSN